MKNIAVFALFILTSVGVFAQTKAEKTPEGQLAHKILLDNGVDRHCFAVVETPNGLYIGSRTEDNIPVNYLYLGDDCKCIDKFKKIEKLDGYVICDYSPLRDELLVGKYENGNGDSMFREIYTYNLKCKTFKKQTSLGWNYKTPKYNEFYDSITVVVNEKNEGGIGSHYATKTVKAN